MAGSTVPWTAACCTPVAAAVVVVTVGSPAVNGTWLPTVVPALLVAASATQYVVPLVSPGTARLRLCGLESVKPTELLEVVCGDPELPPEVHHRSVEAAYSTE